MDLNTLLEWGIGQLKFLGQEGEVSARVLLAETLSIPLLELRLRPEKIPNALQISTYSQFIFRRKNREPTAYILGKKGFFGLEIQLGPGCLIPRPETETLIEYILKKFAKGEHPKYSLDMGTGPGSIALALSFHLKGKIYGVDNQSAPLKWALKNSQNLFPTSPLVSWIQGDRGTCFMPETFDLVVANPPYLSKKEWDAVEPEVRLFEPSSALIGGKQSGSNLVKEFILEGLRVLKPGGSLFIEGNPLDNPDILKSQWSGVQNRGLINDLSLRPRFLFFEKTKKKGSFRRDGEK